MGAWNMKTVMDCLDGAEDVAIADWDAKKRAVVAGCGKIRRLDSYDLALLMVLAHRQHDEEAEGAWTNEECFCYGNEGTLAKLARMGRSKFEECRAFMLARGLISYRESDTCLDLKTGARRKAYNYVYRLNKPALFQLKATLPRKHIPLAPQTSPTCHASTNITTNKITTNRSMSVADAADLKVADKRRAEKYIQYIAQKYGLSPEQTAQIGVEGIVAGTAGKRPDDVKRTIDQFGQTDMLDRKFGAWVGMLVKRFKSLPKADDPSAIPAADELEKQFGTPVKKSDEADFAAELRKQGEPGWNKLYGGLMLGELPEARKRELSAAYVQALKCHPNYLKDIVHKIVDDVAYIKGKSHTFEELRKVMPNVNDRADKLASELKALVK